MLHAGNVSGRMLALLTAMNAIAFYNISGIGPFVSPGLSFPVLAIALFPWGAEHRQKMNSLDLSVLSFVLCCVLSFMLFLLPGNPVSIEAYLLGFNVTIAPIALYLFARLLPGEDKTRFIDRLVVLHFAVAVISLVLHISRPGFYTSAIASALSAEEQLETWQVYARLQGALGSTVMGSICAISILMLIPAGFNGPKKVFFALVFFIVALLSFQRGAMVAAFLASVALWVSTANGKSVVTLITFFLVAVSVPLFFAAQIDSAELNRLVDRVVEAWQTLSFADRPTYQLIGRHLVDYPFGMGLGATTSAADSAGLNPGGQMVDANHMRLLADVGPLGLSIFLLTVLLALCRSAGRRSTLWLGGVVFILNLQALVTNLLDSYYISHLYWMALGMLSQAPKKSDSRRFVMERRFRTHA